MTAPPQDECRSAPHLKGCRLPSAAACPNSRGSRSLATQRRNARELLRDPRLPLLQAGPSGSTPINRFRRCTVWPVNSCPPSSTPPPTPVPRVNSTTSLNPWRRPTRPSHHSTIAVVGEGDPSLQPHLQPLRQRHVSQPGRLMHTRATRAAASIGPGRPTPPRPQLHQDPIAGRHRRAPSSRRLAPQAVVATSSSANRVRGDRNGPA